MYRVPPIPTEPNTVVVRGETRGRHRFYIMSYPSLMKQGSAMTIHEIIREKQKFYIDIDKVPANAPIYVKQDFDWMNPVVKTSQQEGSIRDNIYLAQVLEGILNVFEIAYGVQLKPSDFVVLANKYPGNYSYHVIIDRYCFKDHLETRWLYQQLLNYVDEDVKKSLDCTYKSLQNLRIEGSCKPGSFSTKQANRRLDRYTHPTFGDVTQSTDIDHKSSLVTITHHCELLPLKAYRGITRTITDFTDGKVIDICNEFFKQNGLSPDVFRPVVSKKYIRFIYLPKGSRECTFCERSHESDNMLVYPSADKIVLHCRQSRIVIWERSVKPVIDMSFLSDEPERIPVRKIKPLRVNPKIQRFEFRRAFIES